MDREEVRRHLTGPITSVRTPFLRTGDVDYDGLRRFVDACVEAGSGTILLTAGDSHYYCLSDDEIAQVTRITIDQARRRAMVVAADRHHSTARALEFAEFARDCGADVVMCLPPDWGASCTPASLVEHYVAIGDIIPVMLVTNLFRERADSFGLDTIRKAVDRSKRSG